MPPVPPRECAHLGHPLVDRHHRGVTVGVCPSMALSAESVRDRVIESATAVLPARVSKALTGQRVTLEPIRWASTRNPVQHGLVTRQRRGHTRARRSPLASP